MLVEWLVVVSVYAPLWIGPNYDVVAAVAVAVAVAVVAAAAAAAAGFFVRVPIVAVVLEHIFVVPPRLANFFSTLLGCYEWQSYLAPNIALRRVSVPHFGAIVVAQLCSVQVTTWVVPKVDC